MASKHGVPANLPLEVVERALSYLSVPELCRMRLVCKSWNESISRASFHDLCDVNGGNEEYLCMWSETFREEPSRVVVNPIFAETLSFLDVKARRWYLIPARVSGGGHKVESQFMAMNDGFVCELTIPKDRADNKFALAISDPVAKTRRMLPTPPEVFVAPDIHLVSARILTAVDNATRSYKVFLFNNLPHTDPLRAQVRMYVHESLTDEWRGLRNLPEEIQVDGEEEDWADSAVILQDSVFILKQHSTHAFSYRLSLFRYKLQEDTWAGVYEMYFPRNFECSCQLVASSNRLFLNVWLGGARSSDPNFNTHFSDPGLKSDPDCPDPGAFFDYPNYPDTDTYFEIYEVLIADHRRKPVVQFTYAQILQIFGTDGPERYGSELMNVSHAFPCVDFKGICSSVILVKATVNGFEIKRYDLATGSVDCLPPHPMVQPSEKSIGEYFNVENMKLSLRNLLGQSPNKLASTGSRLLQ